MFTESYKILLNGKYFDAIYPVDFYNDKKVFFDTGARLFFTIYQIISHRKYDLTIEDNENNNRTIINNELQFKDWVAENYPIFLNYLENYN